MNDQEPCICRTTERKDHAQPADRLLFSRDIQHKTSRSHVESQYSPLQIYLD